MCLLNVNSLPSKLLLFFFFYCLFKIFCAIPWLFHLQHVCPHAFSKSRVCSSPCSPITTCPGQPAQRGSPGTKDAKTKICPQCVCFQTHDPRSRHQLHFCSWTSTSLPAPSLATAAAVHRKFVKTHPIPQTPRFQQISIFLQKPVLLETSQPSPTESHYFWSTFVNIYCRVFLNDNSHRLWQSLVWQFESLTLSCALAREGKGKKKKKCVSFNTTAVVWLQDVLQTQFPGEVHAWHSKIVALGALLLDSGKDTQH